MSDQIQTGHSDCTKGAPRRKRIAFPFSLMIAEVGIEAVKDLAHYATHKLRRRLDDWIATSTTGLHQGDNVRRMVSVYDHLDCKDVLIWLTRLRKIDVEPDNSSYIPERVVENEHAEELYRMLNSMNTYEQRDARETIRSIAVRLLSKYFVFAVSYSYNRTSDLQDLHRLVLEKHSDLRSVILWIDQHSGLNIEYKQPWFEYGLVPYVLSETTTIEFDASRTWMLVERAVRDGVNQALKQEKRKVVDATSFVRKSLLKMAQSDAFRTSRTGWRRDKEYLKLMIMLNTTGETIFKLTAEELYHWRTHTFSRSGKVRIGGFTRVYPVGLIEYIPQQGDEELKASHEKTKEMARRMRKTSENDDERKKEYWDKIAALDAFEAYAQGYNIVKAVPSQYEISMASAEDVLRSSFRIILVIMLLLSWERRERAAVLMRYMAIACDVLLDVFMFMHLVMVGGDEGGKDALNLILLKAMVALSHAPLAVFLIMTPVKWIIRHTLVNIIRSGWDILPQLSSTFGFVLCVNALGGVAGLAMMVAFTGIIGAVLEFLLRLFDVYLMVRALIMSSMLVKTIWCRHVSAIRVYTFVTLQCTMYVLSTLNTIIPTRRITIIEETVINFGRLGALTLGSSLLFVMMKMSVGHGSVWRGRRRYAGYLAIFAAAKGISERCGAFYLGMDHEMRAHSYFGPLQLTDISGREKNERDAESHLGVEPPAYTVALRNGFVVG